MTDDHEHPADGPEQEIKSEAPEFAAEMAERTVEQGGRPAPTKGELAIEGAPVAESEGDAVAAAKGRSGEREASPKLERLQKILAQAGIASRRHAEELITQGRVQVNGQTVTVLGTKADPQRDHIRVDGKLLRGAERLRYFVLNKPKGYVTTVTDPEGRPTVMEFFAKTGERLYPVGRLDYQSEGLLLVTNDGELANQLTRAASGVEKTYLVKVAGQPSEEVLDQLRSGIAIDKGRPREGKVHTAPARIRQIRKGENPWYEVVLIEGRNRELRKMFEEIGHHVEKIRRVGYGPLMLDVAPGKTRELDLGEVEALRRTAEGKLKPRRPKASLMLPKEAGQSTEERIAKEAARRAKKFPGQYRRPDRREDAGWRPRERSAEAQADIRRAPREEARGFSSKGGGRFGAKPSFSGRPPRSEGKFRSDRPQTGAKPGFGRRPPRDDASSFRSERPQGRPTRPGNDRPQTGERSGRGPRPFSGRAPGGGFGRAGQARPRLDIRPVDAHESGFDREKPKTEHKTGPRTGPGRSPRREDSARPFRAGQRPFGAGSQRREGAARPFRGGGKPSGERPQRPEGAAKPFRGDRRPPSEGAQRREGSGRAFSGDRKPGSSYRGKSGAKSGGKPAGRPGGKPGGKSGSGPKRSSSRPGGKRNFGRKPK